MLVTSPAEESGEQPLTPVKHRPKRTDSTTRGEKGIGDLSNSISIDNSIYTQLLGKFPRCEPMAEFISKATVSFKIHMSLENGIT